MITQALKDAVKAEADLLKQYATKEELAELDISKLDYNKVAYCIYGQMTGSCYSMRAKKLIEKCAKGYDTTLGILAGYDEQAADMASITDREGYRHPVSAFTAIEVYISKPNAQNANLIAYLKGETDTLEL